MGVWNGALYSDDGGLSYTRSNAYGNARYIAWSFTFRPQAGHPLAHPLAHPLGLRPSGRAMRATCSAMGSTDSGWVSVE